ncbi:hypothetical protein DL93DRAFT_2098123 [Clavulina sp. PMI_390]|nr:hypothetical protein DL93DRAFT_2098123 [Clavulina sp. PMI_390]
MSAAYQALESEVKALDEDVDDVPSFPPTRLVPTSTKRQRHIRMITIASSAVNLLALIYLASLWFSQSSYVRWRGARPVYTPITEPPHKLIVPAGLRGKTPYDGPPSDEVDKLWNDLYAPYLLTGITAHEATQLANATVPSEGTEVYETQIEVFHYLHCLNFLRQLAWPERYSAAASSRYAISRGVVFSHADHCVNAIREALMCNAPIAALPWQFNPHKNFSEIRFDVTQTCSDFSAVQESAKKRLVPGKISVDSLNKTTPPEFVPTHAQLVAAGWEDS